MGRVQGATDLPLTEVGRLEVQGLAEGLMGTRLGVVIAAPDEGSSETARLIAKATGARVQIEAGLAEMHLGLWEGLRTEELQNRCKAGKVFVDDGPGVVPPEGAESLEEYQARILEVVRGLVGKRRLRPVGLVVRPMALGVLRCALKDEDLDSFWQMIASHPGSEWYQVGRHDPRLSPGSPRRRASAA